VKAELSTVLDVANNRAPVSVVSSLSDAVRCRVMVSPRTVAVMNDVAASSTSDSLESPGDPDSAAAVGGGGVAGVLPPAVESSRGAGVVGAVGSADVEWASVGTAAAVDSVSSGASEPAGSESESESALGAVAFGP
jgi:hypothetical protein